MNAEMNTLQLSHQQRGLVGALICICANTLISFALNVQKLAHIKTQEHEENDEEARRGRSQPANRHSGARSDQYGSIGEEQDEGEGTEQHSSGPNTKFLRSGLFWWGLSLMVLGEGGNFISYGFAPASLVAPLGSVALLANVFIAPLLLKERFAKSDLFGVALASFGAAGVVVASSSRGDGSSEPNGPDALWNAIKERDFLIYALVLLVFGCSLAYLSATGWGDKYLLIDVGTCAVFGGFTVLSTKGVSSMLSFGTSRGDILSALKSPLSYGLLFTLVVTAVVQLTFLNRALQRFDARTVIPSQFVFFTISAISGSAVLFRDFERATPGSIAGFLAGCATTFAGVFVLTRQKHDSSLHEQGKDSGHGASSTNDQRQEESGKGRVGSSSVPNLFVDQTPQRVRGGGIANEQSPLIGSSSRDATTPQRRPAGPIATLTTGSVPISSGERHPMASTSLPNANLRMTPASAARPMMRTPRLSLVGGSAMGAGGYLLLATPGSVGAANNYSNTNALQGDSGGGRSLDGRYRGLSVSPTPRMARPAVPQRDIASGSNRGREDDDLRRDDIDELSLSSSVTRALSGPQGDGSRDSNLSKPLQQQRRIRNAGSQSDLSLARSLSGGRAGNRYSREFE